MSVWVKRGMIMVFSAAGVLYGLLVCTGLFCSDALLFYHGNPSYVDTPEIIKLTTADGKKISAIYLPNPNAKYTMLYSHGNGGDLGEYRQWLETLRAMGFSVCSYDYHGFGTSEGKPSEKAAYMDVNAAYDYLTRHLHIPPERIIAFGRSLGGGPTAYLAARRPVAGVIMESTFTTGFRVVTQVPLLPFDKFYSIENIKRVHCPVLVIHGTADRTIPFSHGQALYRAAPEPKMHLWVLHAGHVGLAETAGQQYPDILHAFERLIEQQQGESLSSLNHRGTERHRDTEEISSVSLCLCG